MNRRTALWLVCILCGLLGVYLWQNRPAPAVDPNAPDPSIRTIGNELGLTAETIQAVRLRNLSTGQQVLLRKNSTGQWQTPELVMGLDDQTARLIVRSIELLPYRETIPISNATNLGQYGFAPEGQFSVEVLLQSGVGMSSPSVA